MNNASTGNIPAKIESYVSRNRLRDAFQQLRSYSARLGDWRVTDEIDRLEQSYSMMLRYATQGVDDPGRSDIYASIVRGIYDITDRISRELTKSLSSSVYFSTIRYEAMQTDGNIQMLSERYRRLLSEMSIYNLVTGVETGRRPMHVRSLRCLSAGFSICCGPPIRFHPMMKMPSGCCLRPVRCPIISAR